MRFTLYNYVLSGNCYKVRLMASLAGVTYDSVAVDFHPGGEHRSEALLRLNPAGTLPILVDGETVLSETQAMLVFIACKYDREGVWFPTGNAEQLVDTLQWLGFANRLTSTVGALRLHAMLNRPIDEDSVRPASWRALRELESHLTEQRLRGLQWLCGDHPTVADVACFPYAALSPDAGIEHDDHPAIRRWLLAMRRLDGFITMPGIHELHSQRNLQPLTELTTS